MVFFSKVFSPLICHFWGFCFIRTSENYYKLELFVNIVNLWKKEWKHLFSKKNQTSNEFQFIKTWAAKKAGKENQS